MPAAEEASKAVVRRIVEEFWNSGHLEVADELYDPDFDTGRPGRLRGPALAREWHRREAAIWDGLRYEIRELLAEGPLVAVRWRASGRQVGGYRGTAPAGRTATWEGVHFFEVRAGRVQRVWSLEDTFGQLGQLGQLGGLRATPDQPG